MNRVVFLGAYGAFNCAKVKIKELIDQYSVTNITGFKVFLLNPWTQLPKRPVYPWPFDENKNRFVMTQQNAEYYERLAEWAEEILSAKLDFGITFFDRYYQRRWVKDHKFKKHPFRDNNVGIDLGGAPNQVKWDARPIYDSITFGPLQYYWQKWANVNEAQLKWKFTDGMGDFGTALRLFLDKAAETLSPIVKSNKGRLFWYGRNEERAGVEGDRSELYALQSEIFAKHGLSKSKKFFPCVNRDSDHPDMVLHKSITRAYGLQHGLGAFHEIHPGTNSEIKRFLDAGYVPEKTIISGDGWHENHEPFIAGHRKMYTDGHPMIDLLFEEAVIPNPEPVHKIHINLAKAVPVYKEITK